MTAIRVLAITTWMVVASAVPAFSDAAAVPAPTAVPTLLATVRLVAVPLVPNPHNNVYADLVVVAEAAVEAQPSGQKQLPRTVLVAFWGFTDRELMPAADYQPGTRLALELIPFARADEAIRAAQRLSESEGVEAPLLWAVTAKPASPQ
jgi:hypothetical protein